MNLTASEQREILLYFFSTLPQVIGAILALIGVFIIFKIEKYKREINNFSNYLYIFLTEKFKDSHKILAKDTEYKPEKFGAKILSLKYEVDFEKHVKTCNELISMIGGEINEKGSLKDYTKRISQGIITEYEKFKIYRQRSINLLYFSIIIIILLLMIFYFIPFVNYTSLFYMFITLGIVLTIFYLLWVVNYMIKSIF